MKEPLTSREKEIRDYLIDEHYRQVSYATQSSSVTEYQQGRLDEATAILGKLLDILGG